MKVWTKNYNRIPGWSKLDWAATARTHSNRPETAVEYADTEVAALRKLEVSLRYRAHQFTRASARLTKAADRAAELRKRRAK